jgi:hypothetical protein
LLTVAQSAVTSTAFGGAILHLFWSKVMNCKTYIGIPHRESVAGQSVVTVCDGQKSEPLPLRLDLFNHSPTGFSCNTVHLRTLMAFLMSTGGGGLFVRRRSGKLLILRLTPRGLRRLRLETTRSWRISSSTVL